MSKASKPKMSKAPLAAKTNASKKEVAKARAATTKVAKARATKVVAGTTGAEIIDRLWATVIKRRSADPSKSHSARLLARGTAKVAQKFGEEAVECLIEVVAKNPAAVITESADVLYHLVVMWVAAGVEPAEVWAELQRREGVSGIEEKAARASVATSKIP